METPPSNVELDNLEVQARHWMHDFEGHPDPATGRAYRIIQHQRDVIRRFRMGRLSYSSVEPPEVGEDVRQAAEVLTRWDKELGPYHWEGEPAEDLEDQAEAERRAALDRMVEIAEEAGMYEETATPKDTR